jgi:fructokinase
LHFGSISLVLEPGASSFESLMRRESGKRILSLDPNIRPSLISNREAYRQRLEDWIRLVDIVRLSLADLEWLYPGSDARDYPALAWLGSELVLTLGPRVPAVSLRWGKAEEIAKVPSLIRLAPVIHLAEHVLANEINKLKDKQGLRDLTRLQLIACLEYATRAAAINCSRPGANPPYKHEMERQL